MVNDDLSATLADDERLFNEATSGVESETEPELSAEEAATVPPPGGAERAPEPPAPVIPPSPEPPGSPPEPVLRHVPLSEHLDQRDKLRARAEAAERKAQETERVLREFLAKQQADAQPAPEVWDKPGEFVRREVAPLFDHVQQALQKQEERELQRSYESAVGEFGKDLVGQAYAALEAAIKQEHDPEAEAAHARIMSGYHPWRGVVAWYKRAKVARDPDDLLKDPEFVKRAVESYSAQAAANPVTRSPNSAASLPSVSRVGTPAVPEDDVDAYDKLSDEEAYDYVTRDEKGRFRARP